MPTASADILEEQHIIWVVGAAKYFAFRDAGRRAVLLVPIVTRLPCVEVLDLEVNSQVFVIHLTLLCENLFSTHTTRVARVADQSADADGIRGASQDQLLD